MMIMKQKMEMKIIMKIVGNKFKFIFIRKNNDFNNKYNI